MTLCKAIIVDLDGTLCDHRHRISLIDPEHNVNYLKSINATDNDYDRLDQKNIPLPHVWKNVFTGKEFIPAANISPFLPSAMDETPSLKP